MLEMRGMPMMITNPAHPLSLQISAMEQTVHEMLQQLKDLETENQQLKSKCRVLETSVNCSTQIHGMMKLLDGLNGLSLSPSRVPPSSGGAALNLIDRSLYPIGSNSPGSGTSGGGWFGLQSADRQNSNTASETSGGDTWSSCSGLAYPTQQQQLLLMQQPMQDPWQRMGQTRVITTGAVQGPTAAAAAGNGVTTAEAPMLNGFGAHSSSSFQQQQTPNSSAHMSLNGSAAAGLAGPFAADRSGSNSLQAIFAEAAQQQSSVAAAAAGVSADAAGSDPLAGAATSVEQGMGMYKEFLRQASQLLLQVDLGGPGAEAARATLEALTRVTMSRFQPLLVAKGQGLVYNWITRNLETGQHHEAPEELWPKVLEQMRLTPQQQQDSLACYRMFSICLSKLVDKRMELSEQYKSLQQSSEQCAIIAQQPQQGKVEAAADYRKSKLTSASMEVLQSLAKNLAAYQSLDGVFAHSVTSLLTGVQMATACVHSYPFLPQWHTMMRYLQRQEEAKQQRQVDAVPGTRRSSRGSRAAGAVRA
eukprot:GHUV01014177.1.p1 GENE.GHUV01014177.1~~GHUV01014177.1.p1  ORF type:complete len:532 (+),score=194.44 GHUV01014177.1:331-1926(+)